MTLSLSLSLALGLLSPALTLATPHPSSMESAPRFQRADAAFKKRGDEKEARRALDLYRQLHAAHPNDGEAAWRHAMACEFVGMRLTSDSDEKRKIFAEGRDAGRASLKLIPDCAPCHFWTAINMALYGDAVGILKTLFTLGEVRAHLERTVALDPAYAFGGASRVLGAISERLPDLLGGDTGKAKAAYERAILASPDEPLNYLFLARLLKGPLRDPHAALKVARVGLTFGPLAPERVESNEARADLAALAASLSPSKSAER